MQLVQLQAVHQDLRKLGYGLAALSYDSPEILQEFAQRRKIEYPLLSDAGSHWLTQSGLVNAEAGSFARGVAQPAILVLDREGKITQTVQESAYQGRLTGGGLVQLLAGTPVPSQDSAPERVTVLQHQSDTEVTAGSIFWVDLQVLLPKGYHLYGPAATGVVPVSLQFTPHDFCEVPEVNYPPAPATRVLDEVVPAYQGSVTFRARVELKYDKQTREHLTLLDQMPLQATFQYQVCSDTLCMSPQTQTVRWKFRYLPLDMQRSSEALQHR